jgi:hypothetical protein
VAFQNIVFANLSQSLDIQVFSVLSFRASIRTSNHFNKYRAFRQTANV